MCKKYVYPFAEGNGSMIELLGTKGANLAQMVNLGMPVPPGFTLTTKACNQYYEDNQVISENVINEIFDNLTKLEVVANKKFGDPTKPLLVSVRSGSRASMPGMMDTILNLGLNDSVVEGLSKLTNNPRFAYDSYRRFIAMYSDVVKGLSKAKFETIIDDIKSEKKVSFDNQLTADDLKEMVKRFKEFYQSQLNEEFPSDPRKQLIEALKAVFKSWNNERAIYYRKMNDIPENWGTAVNIQMMVFGNMGQTSGSGVAFTRNPSTGENVLYGEFLIDAQGEDVVAGIRTPNHISKLHLVMPKVYEEFVEIAKRLETFYHDMQDMEFTIENNKLYMLQTRNGKRTAKAALKIACDLVDEGQISKKQAVMNVNPKQLDALLHPSFDPIALNEVTPITTGLPASPGAASGQIVFSAKDAVDYSKQGYSVILVRLETSPEDIQGMNYAKAILTIRGGMTSHAAVVARGMGTICVSGCGEININEAEKYFIINGIRFNELDYISLDGTTGNVYSGRLKMIPTQITSDFKRFMSWADEFRVLKVRTNADTPKDALQAIELGAEGIGLVRSEHMFFKEERIKAIREMIVSRSDEQRQRALDKLLPMQKNDFIEIYKVMKDRPVTIRYLDPPLHEFLPTSLDDIENLATEMKLSVEAVNRIICDLHEFNPMMGHRGCRLDITYPQIAQMQTRAVIEAAIEVNKAFPDYNIIPEIMIPFIGEIKELEYVKQIVTTVANEIIASSGIEMKYLVGTMIEIPRAALLADQIAKEAEFFSFGTNDLTQMLFGLSRDDAGRFLNDYFEKKIYEKDPFAHLDEHGVGQLMKQAVRLGKQTRPNLKLGICGEHGGDPASIEFCHKIGLDYVSCSPFRVPIARLAAAQAALKDEALINKESSKK